MVSVMQELRRAVPWPPPSSVGIVVVELTELGRRIRAEI